MSLRRSLFVICLIGSVLCLAAGYGVAGQWLGVTLAALTGPGWWLARKYPASGLPLVCLLASVGLAIAGRLSGSPAGWMILGSALALATWDLLLLDAALGNPSSMEQTCPYETGHIRSLVLAVGGGLVVTLLGRLLNVQVPFLVLILFIIFILFALDRVWGYLKRTGQR
jgi:hypothetical protein